MGKLAWNSKEFSYLTEKDNEASLETNNSCGYNYILEIISNEKGNYFSNHHLVLLPASSILSTDEFESGVSS